MVTASPRLVEGMAWPDFRDYFAMAWKPGEHVALLGPTGEGKTTLAVQILDLRKWVLAMDPKGGDTTLSTLEGRRGFERIESWPPPKRVLRAIERGEPARLIVGSKVRARSDRPKLRAVLADAIDGAFEMGGWTMYVDELQVATDPRLMNLGASIEENLIAARDRGVSVVTAFQRPARVPRAASEMATWLLVWYTRDRDTLDRIAEMMGRPKAEVRGAVSELREHCLLAVNRSPRQPMIVTRPPKA